MKRLLNYGIAIGTTAIALLISMWLEAFLSGNIGSFFYIAIIINAWNTGFLAGIVTIILSTIAIVYFFIPPLYQFSIDQLDKLLQLGVFILVALIINLITANFRHSKQKIQEINQQLAQENAEQLKMALSASQMGIWDWNILTGEITWSPEHEFLFGLTPGSFDGRYATFDAHIYPEDRPGLNKAIEKALQNHSTYQHEFRVIWPDSSIHWIEGRGNAFYNQNGVPVRMLGTIMNINERKQAKEHLKQQFEQQRLVMEMTQSIRKSLNLQDILQTTVDEVRGFLKCDRVLIFQFSPGWGGTTVVESVADEWISILSLQIYDPCIGEEYVEPFKQGLVTVKHDIYNSGISPCHVEFLASLQVRANLVVPVFLRNELWGLLTAHHCASPRQWELSEIELLRQLGSQVSIAIQQADLFLQIQTELLERQQAQESLAKESLRIHTLFNTSFDGIVILDIQGNVLDANPRFAEMLGYTYQEVIKLNILNWDAQFTKEEIEQLRINSINIKSGVLETRHRRKDDSIFDVEISFSSVESEGEILAFCVCRDISDRKQAQIALQQMNIELEQRVTERTLQLTQVNNQLLETVKEQQRIQLIQQKYSHIVSSTKDAIAMMNCDYIYQIVNQSYLDWCNKSHSEVIGHSVREVLGEHLFDNFIQPRLNKCLNGEIIQYERWFDYPNLVPQFMSVTYTPYRESDTSISGVIVSLRDLTQLKTEQEKTEKIKSEFIGIVSHELRTPLTAIRAAMGLLQTGIYDYKPDKLKRMIEIAAIDSDRLVRLVNDILDLERLDSGRAILEKSICEAADLIQQALAGVQAIANEQHITFKIHHTYTQVWSVPDMIIQTLINLLGNAIKFSPTNSTITIIVEQQTDQVLFQISDQGRGIPSDKLETIFGRFQQVDASDSRSKGGTGLGLAICRSIIDQHSGQIWAESTVGIGSTFFFTLPYPDEKKHD